MSSDVKAAGTRPAGAGRLAGKIALDEHTVIMLTGGNTDAQSFADTITGRD